MKMIEKKIWPNVFKVDKDAVIDFKIADFKLEAGRN